VNIERHLTRSIWRLCSHGRCLDALSELIDGRPKPPSPAMGLWSA